MWKKSCVQAFNMVGPWYNEVCYVVTFFLFTFPVLKHTYFVSLELAKHMWNSVFAGKAINYALKFLSFACQNLPVIMSHSKLGNSLFKFFGYREFFNVYPHRNSTATTLSKTLIPELTSLTPSSTNYLSESVKKLIRANSADVKTWKKIFSLLVTLYA